MNCPKCPDELHEITFEGVEVDFCSSCKGMWFDKDEVAFMVELPVDVPESAEMEKDARKTEHVCPCCGDGVMLEEMRFSKADNLLIDRCPQCKGIWLDIHEFKKLEKISASLMDAKSKIFLACRQLQSKGYEVLGVKAHDSGSAA